MTGKFLTSCCFLLWATNCRMWKCPFGYLDPMNVQPEWVWLPSFQHTGQGTVGFTKETKLCLKSIYYRINKIVLSNFFGNNYHFSIRNGFFLGFSPLQKLLLAFNTCSLIMQMALWPHIHCCFNVGAVFLVNSIFAFIQNIWLLRVLWCGGFDHAGLSLTFYRAVSMYWSLQKK